MLAAMWTALQHLADSLFVNLTNLVLIHHDSYLEHVKQGIKLDTWNLLRNAPLFGYGIFPDSMLCAAEQDINKFESAGAAPGSGPGTSQAGEGISDTGLMREEIPTRILVNQIKSNNHGVNSLGIEPGAGGVEEEFQIQAL